MKKQAEMVEKLKRTMGNCKSQRQMKTTLLTQMKLFQKDFDAVATPKTETTPENKTDSFVHEIFDCFEEIVEKIDTEKKVDDEEEDEIEEEEK